MLWRIWATITVLSDFSSALPSGFEDQGIARVYKIVDISFGINDNDEHIGYGVTKKGKVHVLTNFVMDDDSAEEEEVLDLRDSVCDDKERGATGIVLHPDFRNNNYVYIFYTRKNLEDDPQDGCQWDEDIGPRNTIVRYTAKSDGMLDPNSEEIILQTLPLGNGIHNGGDMHFGIDKMLYVSLGDAGYRSEAYSTNLRQLFGSMLRITEDGDIPSDGLNPYSGSGTAPCRDGIELSRNKKCQEIFAYG